MESSDKKWGGGEDERKKGCAESPQVRLPREEAVELTGRRDR